MALEIEHIWWDFDGTLYKMPPEFEEAKMRRRLELFSEVTGKPVNGRLRKDYEKMYKQCGSHSAVFVSLGKPKDYWQNEHQKMDVLQYLKPDSRTVEMFHMFASMPYTHSIFTNRKRDYMRNVLSKLQIDYNLFRNIITNDDINHPKPHPEGFEKMIELSKIPAERILYIGDRIEADILPAKNAGMKTALVWSEKEKTEADYSFRHVADVIMILR